MYYNKRHRNYSSENENKLAYSRNLFHEKLHIFLLKRGEGGGGVNREEGLINFFTPELTNYRGRLLHFLFENDFCWNQSQSKRIFH